MSGGGGKRRRRDCLRDAAALASRFVCLGSPSAWVACVAIDMGAREKGESELPEAVAFTRRGSLMARYTKSWSQTPKTSDMRHGGCWSRRGLRSTAPAPPPLAVRSPSSSPARSHIFRGPLEPGRLFGARPPAPSLPFSPILASSRRGLRPPSARVGWIWWGVNDSPVSWFQGAKQLRTSVGGVALADQGATPYAPRDLAETRPFMARAPDPSAPRPNKHPSNSSGRPFPPVEERA